MQRCVAIVKSRGHEIIYRSKDNKQEKIFDALDWLATIYPHISNHGEQMVRYYGFYSNVSRGSRQRENQEVLISSQTMEILFDLSHLTVGLIVEFNP
jgi:hypothetical protein